jgi:hypothetical protein
VNRASACQGVGYRSIAAPPPEPFRDRDISSARSHCGRMSSSVGARGTFPGRHDRLRGALRRAGAFGGETERVEAVLDVHGAEIGGDLAVEPDRCVERCRPTTVNHRLTAKPGANSRSPGDRAGREPRNRRHRERAQLADLHHCACDRDRTHQHRDAACGRHPESSAPRCGRAPLRDRD